MKNTKPLIIDTTFILPLFGIQILIFNEFQAILKNVWKNEIKGYNVYLPSTCLIESMFKLLHEYRKKEDYNILNRYYLALPTLLNLPIYIINCELDPKICEVAMKIRHLGHSDFMDCWIAGTAAVLQGVLLSEDKELTLILKQIPETKKITVWNWTDLLKKIS